MINQRPKCIGCGLQVKVGEGFYNPENDTYMHSEEYDKTKHKKAYLRQRLFNVGDKIHIASIECAVKYALNNNGKPYEFDPEKIKPITELDDIKQE